MNNLGQEFKKYATYHMGLNTLTTEAVMNHQANVDMAMTPYILEEREMRVTQMDIFSRLMRDRILWLAGGVDDRMSTVVQAQLMFLDNVNSKSDITMHIDSPGGSVKSGLSMINLMEYVSCDIATVNTGLCASMGAVLLAAGTKGKRSSLRFSRTMVHQSSGGAGGHISDAKITWREWEKVNAQLFDLLSEYTGRPAEQIIKDADRDLWFSAQEAVEYGLIDEVIKTKKEAKK